MSSAALGGWIDLSDGPADARQGALRSTHRLPQPRFDQTPAITTPLERDSLMTRLTTRLVCAVAALALLGVSATAVSAQLSFEQAEAAMDAAEAEARANGWNLTILIADADGVPMYLRRMDGASVRTHDIVTRKVHVVLTTGGPSLAYGQALAAGTMDTIPGGIHYEGGLPIRMGGVLVGAMAASGATGAQDAQVVRAGLAAIGAGGGR